MFSRALMVTSQGPNGNGIRKEKRLRYGIESGNNSITSARRGGAFTNVHSADNNEILPNPEGGSNIPLLASAKK